MSGDCEISEANRKFLEKGEFERSLALTRRLSDGSSGLYGSGWIGVAGSLGVLCPRCEICMEIAPHTDPGPEPQKLPLELACERCETVWVLCLKAKEPST